MTKNLPAHLAELQTKLIALFDKVESGEVEARAGEVMAKIAVAILDISKFALETGEAEALAKRVRAVEADLREMAS